ncbi:hypothetical protein RhiirA5_394557 [Rhizophagus irregularis]|uniref:F-box domain-containing protein n=2 Tax=Rhizophagus irregularis TaxID=588596 RepID=U9UTI1_RHIID|nr:hypothetical protein GLOIN_2v1837893 [Rhizophagus irregularis DAOM 181602=DAOM 197198]PKC16132.1 hypothetical protein RhiirA5_394557 [Rhizophagus irregularis]PKC73505.1 hypothetical protein RhiirA1_410473 [Rhizophagus irregularis]PKK69392.1 hypothetical protein RhiirC2_866770 [Rhizophagus irregularis]PKY27021.1 hypothetical protein RhiirB3_415712 [Rhizophagus irregularis]POG76827.1 hypothetical protein GLOIN_2v1837893 [Rhizophagus irregularis DAOM 181602=DAOM 197198]|eukprot:XP_025183693.1 hypothetical protein GLOIN_2v1837893 [Rhizophagus irregularis DAOM 181602=DAOM 197198]
MTPEQNISKVNSPIASLPPELFAKFCAYLPPADLFTLSQVCRKFHGYLCAPNSFSTQQIWKESRLKFMPKEEMPPPKGMSEKNYVELLMMDRGCQTCKQIKICKIYWEFEVRICEECFLVKTVNEYKLLWSNYPQEFLNTMPHTYYFYGKYYWIEQIHIAYSQYYSLSKEDLKTWLDSKKLIFDSTMEYATKRGMKHDTKRPSRFSRHN